MKTQTYSSIDKILPDTQKRGWLVTLVFVPNITEPQKN